MSHTTLDVSTGPVICRGCGDTIATFGEDGLGAARTAHDQACPTHSFTGRCTHEGTCYEVPVQQDGGL